MKTIYYPYNIDPTWPQSYQWRRFLQKSTLKLRSALHFRYSIVIPRFIPRANTAQSYNHYKHGFCNTFDYNYFIYSDYLLYTVTYFRLKY